MTGKRILMTVALVVGLVTVLWAEEEPGLLISGVVEDSPAETAGLIRGDILLEFDGKEVESSAELREILSDYRAGQRVVLTILRGGDERKVTLNLEDRLYRPVIGLEFATRFNLPRMAMVRGRQTGVIIVEVMEDGPAEQAGLEPRDAILTIDGERVAPEEFSEIISSRSAGDRVTFEISRPGDDGDEPFEVTVRLGENDDGGGYLGIRFTYPGSLFGFVPEVRGHLEDLERGLRGRFEEQKRGGFRLQLPMEEKTEI